MISLDTETTGVDHYHGTKPFFVTTCDENGEQRYWEWNVDPYTRDVEVDPSDLDAIRLLLSTDPTVVLHNTKFDVKALESIGVDNFNWNRYYDTLLAAHILASNQQKDLTALAVQYLNIDIQPFEDVLEKAVKECRTWARNNKPSWRIANKEDEDMPSAKEKTWKFDTWLPRLLAQEREYKEPVEGCDHDWGMNWYCQRCNGHRWWVVLSDYANTDSAVTLPLWQTMEEEIKLRGQWKNYLERLKVLRPLHLMEKNGLTVNLKWLDEKIQEFSEGSVTCEHICTNIAAGYEYELQLPKGGRNKSLDTFLTDVMKLKPMGYTKTGNTSYNKEAMEGYMATLPENSLEYTFVSELLDKRSQDTAISYMNSYKKFGIRIPDTDYIVLHPNINPTGTDTTRCASNNPNGQNISKKEKRNIRSTFGPLPDREWWTIDAENLELRIPAYEANEEEMIFLFENPNQPPYFGSYHMLIFDTLHPDKFKKHGIKCKSVYESTWYQWTKNGNFAVQYGAQEVSGTADRAYHVPGAQHRIQSRFTRIQELSQRQIKFAENYGYVETIPDKSVDPERGYPLLCTRSKWGNIKSTVPLSYHIQGTACLWMQGAEIRCQAALDDWNNRERKSNPRYRMFIQVHDELGFDFPRRAHPLKDPKNSNLDKIREIKKLMEIGGEYIGVRTTVSIKYHTESWAKGETIKC